MITIKSSDEIQKMREVGKLAAKCLVEMSKLIIEGNTPKQIDDACHKWTLEHNAIPATLNYKGYPANLCVSVNDVVCHGVPNEVPFKKGDIVNLDVTPILNGYHGDTNATFVVGSVNDDIKKFIDVAYLSMWEGIKQVCPGNTVGDIGHAIETYVKSNGYSVVVEYCGHGIGKNFHEDPNIVHVGRPKQGVVLREGMTFTIEPMINMGGPRTKLENDDWTVRTVDGSLSAQFEHTVLVTKTGVEVLTLRENEKSLL
ncbi:MAG: type I methionyl aminopeptidase [Oligoflexia bacterium]|nr:type I methionyl aminopeptidase [Oligoflexia bacterium]